MKIKSLACVLIAGICQSAFAVDSIEDYVRFSGFGTLAVSHSDTRDADYRSNIQQSTGVGMSNNPDSGLDSILGTQIDIRLAHNLNGTAQIISRRLSDYNSTRPYFEWANIKYDIDEQSYIRAGRFVAPTFMISESRMIGYAQPAVRPVAEVYLLSPISYMNGVDGGYKFPVGRALVKMRAGIGTLNQDISQVNGTLSFKFDIKSFDTSVEYSGSTFRLGYQRINMDVGNDALELYDQAMDMLETNGATNAASIHKRMSRLNVPLDFISLGYMYDQGSLFVQSEYAVRKFHTDFVQSLDGLYFLTGYHFGSLSPYLAFSKLMHRDKARFPALDTSSIDPALGGLVTAVNAGSQLLIARDAWTLGVRWDLLSGVALKAQIDHVIKPKNTAAEFVNASNEFFSEQRDINIVSAAVDFTF